MDGHVTWTHTDWLPVVRSGPSMSGSDGAAGPSGESTSDNPWIIYGCDYCTDKEVDGSVKRIRGLLRYCIPEEDVDCCAMCFELLPALERTRFTIMPDNVPALPEVPEVVSPPKTRPPAPESGRLKSQSGQWATCSSSPREPSPSVKKSFIYDKIVTHSAKRAPIQISPIPPRRPREAGRAAGSRAPLSSTLGDGRRGRPQAARRLGRRCGTSTAPGRT